MPASRLRDGLFPAGLAATLVGVGLYFDHVASGDVTPVDSYHEETAMNGKAKSIDPGKAQHGPRNEVTWEGGSGRQPYANQGGEETTESDNRDVPEGNRGAESGRNLDQLDKARGTP